MIWIMRSVNAVILQNELWTCPDCQKGVVCSLADGNDVASLFPLQAI